MTKYDQMAAKRSDGQIGPYGCSGLAIISKYPFKNVSFFKLKI